MGKGRGLRPAGSNGQGRRVSDLNVPTNGAHQNGNRPLRIVIVDDHQLVSDGLGMLLGSQPDFEVAGFANAVADVAALTLATDPDVVVMDFHLRDGTGLDAAVAIRKVQPNARFVFLSRDDSDSAWLAAIEAGAGAFIHKSRAATDVIEAVRQVGNGASLIPPSMISSLLSRNRETEVRRESLSGREREVLQLMSEGWSSREIAEKLGISYATVRTHIRSVDTKLGAHSKIEAVVTAREMNIIE
jgi:DNA-binding NarL/FixJ family response regulator